jgi:thioesterase domain-containing protein
MRDALEGLTPDQRERLTQRLRERRRASAGDDRIGRRADPQQHPLSPAQERIWKLSRLRPDEPVYNLHEATRLRGPLDADALRRSFALVAERHETLRATFVDDAGHPRQQIAPPGDVAFDEVDVADGGMAQARDLARREAERPFDLARGPLLRVRLLRLAHDDHLLLVTAHHIVCDGWSMGLIETEVSEAYRALTTDGQVASPTPELQYADIAHWQRERDDATGAGIGWWERQLSGAERLRLPGDTDRPSGRTTAGAHRDMEVSGALTAAVRDLSRRLRVTPFITLMSAFHVLLNRSTGQEDLLVCTPVAGRAHHETERMVGYFNNLVVIRGDLSGDPSFEQVVTRMRAVVGGAFDHQDVPFQSVAALPQMARTPLTRALFVLQDATSRALSLPGVEATTVTVEAATADFDLGVFVRPDGDRLVGTVRYRTDQFDDATITTLLTDLQGVLELAVATPERRLSDMPTFATSPARTAATPTARPMERPRSAIESELRDIWQRVFDVAPISIHDDFFELGGHSLLAAEVAAEVEQHITGRPLPLATLFTAPTIAQLATLIDEGEWDRAWSSLVPIKPTGARPPLFFVHAHGGNVIGYRDLARHLPPEQPFYGLQAPDMHESAGAVEPRGIPDIAARYLAEVRSVAPDGPYFFGGWCLGGDVAYEMAAQATAGGLEVPLVVMVDNPRPAHIASARSGSALLRLRNRLRTRVGMEWRNLTELRGRARWSHVAGRARHVSRLAAVRVEARVAAVFAGTSMRLPMSRAYRLEQIAAAHEKAYQAYDPPNYDGQVALFRAEHQPAGRADDRSLGWAPHVGGALAVHDVPGDRIGLLSEPRVGPVAGRIVDAMDQALMEQHTAG